MNAILRQAHNNCRALSTAENGEQLCARAGRTPALSPAGDHADATNSENRATNQALAARRSDQMDTPGLLNRLLVQIPLTAYPTAGSSYLLERPVTSRCAVCGYTVEFDPAAAHREIPICTNCGATPRFCGLAFAVIAAIYDESADLSLREQRQRKDITAIGVSDDDRLAAIFSEKFTYKNTFYHMEPRVDLCNRASCMNYRANLITCSDVLEHTSAPPIVPLTNLFQMLLPGGALVLSAPTFLFDATVEWYGGVREMTITQENDHPVVRWSNRRGVEYVDTSPIFHGGPGQTLELRMISHHELLATARAVGFTGGTLEFNADWGYSWPIIEHFSYAEAPCDSRIILLRRPGDTV